MSGRTFVRRRGTTVVPNATVFDSEIGLAALGVLTFLLARPDRAPQGYRALLGRGLGERAILNAFKELAAAGYRHQVKLRETDGRWLTHTVVSEEPITDETARNYLQERLNAASDRADDASARPDLRKHTKPAGRTVHDVPRLGAPRLGEKRHLSNESQGVESLRSQHRGNQRAPEQRMPPDFRAQARRHDESG